MRDIEDNSGYPPVKISCRSQSRLYLVRRASHSIYFSRLNRFVQELLCRLENLMPELAMLMPCNRVVNNLRGSAIFMSGYLSFTNEKLIARPIATIWVGWRNYERLLLIRFSVRQVKHVLLCIAGDPIPVGNFTWVQRCY